VEDTELKRLRWRCRRGMKELDSLLVFYLNEQYSRADELEKQAFKQLLEMQDPQVYALILGKIRSEDEGLERVVRHLQNTPYL
jgi:antitoxin CptB